MARKTLWASGAALLLGIAVLSRASSPTTWTSSCTTRRSAARRAEPQRSVAVLPRRLLLVRLAPARHRRLPAAALLPLHRQLPGPAVLPLLAPIADPVAARVQGAVFFLVWLLLSLRLLRVRPAALLLAALLSASLPGHVPRRRGTGGSRSGAAGGRAAGAAASAARAARRVPPSPRASLAGALLFLGLWSKLVFAWSLPDRGRLRAWRPRPRRRLDSGDAARPRARAREPLAGLGLPTLLLLASVDGEGRPYFSSLRPGPALARRRRPRGAPRPPRRGGASTPRSSRRATSCCRSPLDAVPRPDRGARVRGRALRGARRGWRSCCSGWGSPC